MIDSGQNNGHARVQRGNGHQDGHDRVARGASELLVVLRAACRHPFTQELTGRLVHLPSISQVTSGGDTAL